MSVGWGVVCPNMEVATCTVWDYVPMEHTCSLHGGGFLANKILLSIQEQSNCRGCQEQFCSRVRRDDTNGVMELFVLKAKLICAAVGVGFGILAGTGTKKERHDE